MGVGGGGPPGGWGGGGVARRGTGSVVGTLAPGGDRRPGDRRAGASRPVAIGAIGAIGGVELRASALGAGGVERCASGMGNGGKLRLRASPSSPRIGRGTCLPTEAAEIVRGAMLPPRMSSFPAPMISPCLFVPL